VLLRGSVTITGNTFIFTPDPDFIGVAYLDFVASMLPEFGSGKGAVYVYDRLPWWRREAAVEVDLPSTFQGSPI
jgi:hypothetical protein